MTEALVWGVLIGVAATVTMDVLGSAAGRIGLVKGAKGRWVGRWYLGIPRGQFVHSDITAAPEVDGETSAAYVGHYLIGIALAIAYVFVASVLGIPPSSFFVALGYGLVTCIFPWFLVFPALGFGAFGVAGPKELRLFSSSVLNHSFYGLGLWWSVNLFQHVV